MKTEGLKVNVLGDSITYGVGTSAEQYRFCDLLKKECGFDEVRNYGMSGTRFARQTECAAAGNDCDGNFCARAEKMDPDADVVIVFGGTNDYGHGNAPVGGSYDRTRDTFCGACHELFSELLTAYPAATVVVVTPMHRADEVTPYENFRTEAPLPLSAFVSIIRDVAAYYSIPVFDAFARCGIQPAIDAQKEIFAPDGAHPNDAGNARFCRQLISFLKTL